MYVDLIEKAFWAGVIGFGFAVLFNVPYRLLVAIFLTSFLAGLAKFGTLILGYNMIFAALAAASVVGFISIPISRYKFTSPFVVSIPSVIGMIPGYFGYKTLLGIMQIAMSKDSTNEVNTILSITQNAVNMFFILASLAIGVSLPWLLLRKKGIEKIKFSQSDDLL